MTVFKAQLLLRDIAHNQTNVLRSHHQSMFITFMPSTVSSPLTSHCNTPLQRREFLAKPLQQHYSAIAQTLKRHCKELAQKALSIFSAHSRHACNYRRRYNAVLAAKLLTISSMASANGEYDANSYMKYCSQTYCSQTYCSQTYCSQTDILLGVR